MDYLINLGGITASSSAHHILIVATFTIIGFGLKYIDDVFDEELFNKSVAMLLAPILVLLWAGVSIYDSFSATILFAILLAVLISGKVDNLIFRISSIALIFSLFLTKTLDLSLIPLFSLTLLGVADELGNDYVDKQKTHEVCEFLFSHRCCMKVGVLGLCCLFLLPWLYLIAFLAFDSTYEAVRLFEHQDVSDLKIGAKQFYLATIILHKFK